VNTNELYIQRCLQLAKNGLGTTRPNPSVGSVIVCDEKIIGEGFTSSYGGNHAEVNAILSVKDKTLLQKATLYVTLEPCAHFGKTPPCADLIVKHKIPKVVIGCIDTNLQVAGKGVERLKNAGCEVVVGVLEDECLLQHKRFFTVQNKKRPYIILKWAETENGFIAPLQKNENRPVWISNSYAQQLVHKWRSEEHAILVGTTTAIADNPKLDLRSWGGNNPVRLVMDRKLRIPKSYALFDDSIKTIVFTEEDNRDESYKNIEFKKIDFSENIPQQICKILFEEHIQSLIVEGGRQTLQSFIDVNLWDEARVFVGDVFFEEGIKAPKLPVSVSEVSRILNTKLHVFQNTVQNKL
jgi:diaminohydroxyphosphoribosylaminopyrimidine deaminase / 5-amino-6-(5-phosphoribosylamino)uracil reductase